MKGRRWMRAGLTLLLVMVAWATLCGVASAQEKPQLAVQQAAEAVEDAPRNFMVQHYGGQVFLARERWALALAAYDRAETVLSGQVAVAFFRARAMEGLGRTREAAGIYRQIRDGAPGTEWATAADARLKGLGAA